MQLYRPGSSCTPRADESIMQRFRAVAREARTLKKSLYHLTESCKLQGACKTVNDWGGITENGMDTSPNAKEATALEKFVEQEAQRGVNAAVLVGRAAELYPDKVAIFRKHMKKITLHTNGLERLPIDGFEDVTISISLFGGNQGGGPSPFSDTSEKSFIRSLDRNLINYSCDPRAVFIYTISEASVPYMEETIKRISQHGLRVFLNYSVEYSNHGPQEKVAEQFMLETALELKERYPDVVVGHPYLIRALITGKSHWGTFSYQSCPSISQDHHGNTQRIANGNHFLPKFNAWPADRSYPNLCYASGICNKCRDSQAIGSWLLVNVCKFMTIENGIQLWTEIAEAYFSQFIWSQYHPLYHLAAPDSMLNGEHIFAINDD